MQLQPEKNKEQRTANRVDLENTTEQYELDKEKFQQTFDEIKDSPGEQRRSWPQ